MRPCAAALLVTLLVAPSARAQEPEAVAQEPEADPRERCQTGTFALGAELSPLGGPVGLAGVVADVPLIPELSITGGAGLGTASPQFAAGLRPRYPISPIAALSATVSYSHGDYNQVDIEPGGSTPWTWRNASWVNVNVGLDLRFTSHVMVRPYFGAGKVVYSSPVTRSDGSTGDPPPTQWKAGLVYTGVAIGFWTGL